MNHYIHTKDDLIQFCENRKIHVYQFDEKMMNALEESNFHEMDEIIFYPDFLNNVYEYEFTKLQSLELAKQTVISFDTTNTIPKIFNCGKRIKRAELRPGFLDYNLQNYHFCFVEIHLDLTNVSHVSECQLNSLCELKKHSKLSVKLSLSNLKMYSDAFLDNLNCHIVIDQKDLSLIAQKNLKVYRYCIDAVHNNDINEFDLPNKFDVYFSDTFPDYQYFIRQYASRIDELIFQDVLLNYECELNYFRKVNSKIKIKFLDANIRTNQNVSDMIRAINSLQGFNVSFDKVNIDYKYKHPTLELTEIMRYFEKTHINICTIGNLPLHVKLRFAKSCYYDPTRLCT